jgi:hypothetical protein
MWVWTDPSWRSPIRRAISARLDQKSPVAWTVTVFFQRGVSAYIRRAFKKIDRSSAIVAETEQIPIAEILL